MDIEIPQVGDTLASLVGGEERMIEQIVEVGAEGGTHLLAETEHLVDAQIDAPGSWTEKRIAPRHRRVVEHVGADAGHRERRRIPDPVAGRLHRVSYYEGP